MDRDEKILILEEYKQKLLQWQRSRANDFINQNKTWVRREVIGAATPSRSLRPRRSAGSS